MPGYHLGVRHSLAALTAGPLPSAHSASINFSAVVPQKSPPHHLPSYVCKMRQNFKPVHGHGDFQRVIGELRDCIYAFPLQVLMFFNLLIRFPPRGIDILTSAWQDRLAPQSYICRPWGLCPCSLPGVGSAVLGCQR